MSNTSNSLTGIGALKVKRASDLTASPTKPANDQVPTALSKSSLDATTLAANDPTEGGKGGEPGLPPSPVANAAFVEHVIRGVADGASAAICSKPNNPETGGWIAIAAEDVDVQCPSDRNNYVNCSSFVHDQDGTMRAKLATFSGFHILVLDDVGTKVDRNRLAGVVPSWEIETSPGNSQLGFILAEPLRDLQAVERLQSAVMKAGLSDPGASGAARWVRLPTAINGKPKHHNERGEAFACKLVGWKPEKQFTVQELYSVLGLDSSAQATIEPTVKFPKAAYVTLGDGVWTSAPSENPVLAALRDRGLYKDQISPGKHDVTCPWVGEHTDAIDGGTAYFEPNADYPSGGFKCQHSHGERYHLKDLAEFLNIAPEAARGRARIDLVPGEMNRIKRAAEASLFERGGFYQMGGSIVSIHFDPSVGGASIERLSEATLTAELSDAADWYRYDARSKKSIRIDPPARNVHMLLNGRQYDILPVLTGLARQPFFRDDGTLVTASGYDVPSMRYGAFDGARFALPEPTETAARQALAALEGLLVEFRFAGPEDRSAALCAMLTAAVRPSLLVAPAFSITASAPGSGKSYLASTIVPFAGPGHAAKVSYPTTAEEASKAMLSALSSNPAAIVFDDMQSDWRPFGAINRMLTSDTITDRLLGTNQTATASTRSLIIGTGNNISPVRDMTRRVVSIRLHHQVETPALEEYDGRPAEAVTEDRESFVVAALTIVAAWRAAGSPKADLPSIASYGEWSDMCRQPLAWLGLPDPATSLIQQINHDPDRDLLGALLKAWYTKFGETSFEVRTLVEDTFDSEDLQEALLDLPVAERETINRNKLGWYLKQNANRVVGGLELQRVDNAHRTAWRVTAMPG